MAHLPLIVSSYVKLVITVPETHGEIIRQTLGTLGAGVIGNYQYCSFSITGKGRFMPLKGANPHIGKEGILEVINEEKIETICAQNILEIVLEGIKKVHPYEETIIEIYPIYELGRKNSSCK